MIQFNLLPDVKLEYVKARRTKQLMILISMSLAGASLAVLILMSLTVFVVQKKSLHDANKDIDTYSTQLKAVPDLDKVLTVQNQLNTLTDLHKQKVVSSRLFTFMSQVTPAQDALSKINVDYTQNLLTISWVAPSLDVVNAYTDTLKNTTYHTDDSSSDSKQYAFSSVVLSSFGRDSTSATFTITMNFDPAIFSSASANIGLTVPAGTTGAQSQLFQKVGN